MREILFRGMAINRDKGSHRSNYKNGDWVYGLLTRKFNEEFKFPAEMSDGCVSGIEIDYATIGQYVGREDKNGKKIFEDDIIKFKWGMGNCAGFIAFDTYNLEYCVRSVAGTVHPLRTLCDWNIEVIGNLYEKPELLKEGD